jgi:UDP-glucose 4-epimerase
MNQPAHGHILVTGGCGYIGSHIVRKLSEAGQKVIVLDNLSTGFERALLHNETLIQADLADLDKLDQILHSYNISAIMHMAASTSVPESLQNPAKYYQNNTINTFQLLQACLRHQIKNFIFSSTAAVYGLVETGIADEKTNIFRPINPYGHSKLAAEYLINDLAAAANLNFIILRYFNVAGAEPHGRLGSFNSRADNLIKKACQAALGKISHLEVYGDDYPTMDGTPIRDFIHVEDLAEAHLLALNYVQQKAKSATFNLGYGKGYSVYEVIEAFNQIIQKPLAYQVKPRRTGDLPKMIAKVDGAFSLLDWKPAYNQLSAILEHAYNWEKSLAQ